ncbi:MAG: lamin tail domain-containing protein, partial [Saprospiraceae bacterium]|nr:lamin tail domain-containing protein [Saprospiraceae bacterium]
MTRYLSIIFLTFISTLAYSQIVINEISYNPPESGQDSLEYIELYNLGSNAVDLSNFVFTSGINLTFDTGISIEAGGYLIVCESSDAMMNVFGVEGIVWDGGMSNGGEAIALKDAAGV